MLPEIAHWLGQNPARYCAATRRLLERRGIAPAAQMVASRRELLWRWEDLHVLAERIPRAEWTREAA
jgi:hypothetical protein